MTFLYSFTSAAYNFETFPSQHISSLIKSTFLYMAFFNIPLSVKNPSSVVVRGKPVLPYAGLLCDR